MVTLLMVAMLSSAQSEDFDVKLNETNTDTLLNLGGFHIKVKYDKDQFDEDQKEAKVTIELKKVYDNGTQYLIVFLKQLSEKELKNKKVEAFGLWWRLLFDNNYYGDKNIEGFPEMESEKIIGPTDGFRPLVSFNMDNNTTTRKKIPIYIAENKKNKKFSIIEKRVVPLNITMEVNTKLNELYNQWKNEYDNIKNQISEYSFCNNPSHKEDIKIDEKIWKPETARQELIHKRDTLVKLIEDLFENKGWGKSGFGIAEKFQKLQESLNNIDFNQHIGDCGKCEKRCPVPGCGEKLINGKCPKEKKCKEHGPYHGNKCPKCPVNPPEYYCKICNKSYPGRNNCPKVKYCNRCGTNNHGDCPGKTCSKCGINFHGKGNICPKCTKFEPRCIGCTHRKGSEICKDIQNKVLIKLRNGSISKTKARNDANTYLTEMNNILNCPKHKGNITKSEQNDIKRFYDTIISETK